MRTTDREPSVIVDLTSLEEQEKNETGPDPDLNEHRGHDCRTGPRASPFSFDAEDSAGDNLSNGHAPLFCRWHTSERGSSEVRMGWTPSSTQSSDCLAGSMFVVFF